MADQFGEEQFAEGLFGFDSSGGMVAPTAQTQLQQTTNAALFGSAPDGAPTNAFRETVFYTTTPNGVQSIISANINRNPFGLEFKRDGTFENKTAEIEISQGLFSDITGITKPSTGDQVLFDETVWFVTDVVLEQGLAVWTLTIGRQELVIQSGEKYLIDRGF